MPFSCISNKQQKTALKLISFIFFTFIPETSCLVHAQDAKSNNNTQKHIEKLSLDKTSDVVNQNENNLLLKNRYREYQQLIAEKVLPFQDTARKSGFSATSEELYQQSQMLKRMFPGIQIDINSIKNEIAVHKYLENFYGQNYSDKDIRDTYTNLVNGLSQESIPSIDEINSHLKLRVLLSKPDIDHEIVKIQEEKERKRLAILRNVLETWPVEDLKIFASDEECVATCKDSNRCLITVKQYNDNVRYQNIPKRVSIDSARYIAVNNMLTDLFIIKQAEDSGFANSDSAKIMKENYLIFQQKLRAFSGLGRPVTDKNSLWRAYGDYYNPLFKPRKDMYISFLGSSDTSYIDSIVKILLTKNGNKHETTDSISRNIIWKHSLKTEMPTEISVVCDTLRKGQISTVKTNYGNFIIRNDSSIFHPEKRFEEVENVLVYLATKQKWLNIDSIYEENALNIYKKNKHFSITPDTFALTIRYCTDTSYKINNLNAQSGKPVKKDDAKLIQATLNVTSSILPFAVQEKLMDAYDHIHNVNGMPDSIRTNLGVWYIKVLSQKPGGLTIPFKFVKKHIVDSVIEADMDNHFKNPLQVDSTMDKAALAQVYKPHFLGMDGKLTDKLIIEMKNRSKKKNDTKEVDIKEAVVKYNQSQIGKIEEWLSSIVINKANLQ